MTQEILDQGLYKLTQYLFDKIHNILPEKLHNLPIEVVIEGYFGAYFLTRALQLGSKNIASKIIPDFDRKALPKLERICEFGLPAAFLTYSLIEPHGARDLIYNKPMDNLGIFMAYLGGITAAEQDLNKCSRLL